MKRDMDLVRKILLDIEGGKHYFQTASLDDEGNFIDDEKVNLANDLLLHHVNIMHGAGFVTIQAHTNAGILLEGLTWAGHDFVDTIRDDTTWGKTKDGAKKVGGAGFGFIVELAKSIAKGELQKHGVPFL